MSKQHKPLQLTSKASRMTMQKLWLLGLVGILLTAGGRLATEPIKTSGGYAVSGYDTVAYFTENKAVRGNEMYAYDWKAVTWLFATAEHLELFQATPERYAPQYGGHCAWGIGAKGGLYSADPLAWKIIDTKLYLNYNPAIRDTWLRSTQKFIKKGDAVWKKIIAKEKGDS